MTVKELRTLAEVGAAQKIAALLQQVRELQRAFPNLAGVELKRSYSKPDTSEYKARQSASMKAYWAGRRARIAKKKQGRKPWSAAARRAQSRRIKAAYAAKRKTVGTRAQAA